MICLLAKNAKFQIFVDRSLKLYNKFLWYAEFDGVIFVKIVCFLGGVSPCFLKWVNFSQARNFWWVQLILMKLTYLKSALKYDPFDVTIGIKIPFFRVSVTIEPSRFLLQFVTTNCLISAWHSKKISSKERFVDIYLWNLLMKMKFC